MPLFQNEFTCKCETFHTKCSSIFKQIKVIFIRMVFYLDSLWNRGTRELGNDLLPQAGHKSLATCWSHDFFMQWYGWENYFIVIGLEQAKSIVHFWFVLCKWYRWIHNFLTCNKCVGYEISRCTCSSRKLYPYPQHTGNYYHARSPSLLEFPVFEHKYTLCTHPKIFPQVWCTPPYTLKKFILPS